MAPDEEPPEKPVDEARKAPGAEPSGAKPSATQAEEAPAPQAPPAEPRPEPSKAADEPEERGERRTRRERRLEHLRELSRKEAPKKYAQYAALGVLVVLVVGGIVWATPRIIDYFTDPCELKRTHEHGSFMVVNDGTRVRFIHPQIDLESPGRDGKLPMKLHMHFNSRDPQSTDDTTLHLEYGCATMSDFFNYLDGDLSGDRLLLPPMVEGGGTELQSNTTHKLQFFLFQPSDSKGDQGIWEEFPDLPGHQMRQYERALITWGNLTAEQISAQQGQVPKPPPGG